MKKWLKKLEKWEKLCNVNKKKMKIKEFLVKHSDCILCMSLV